MDKPFIRRPTISRPSYNKESSSVYGLQLEGVSVKFNPFNQPDLVVISDMAIPPFPPQGRFNYDFSVEYKVLEDCNATYRQLAAEREQGPSTEKISTITSPTSMIPVSTPILQPTVVGGVTTVNGGGVVGSQGQLLQPTEGSLNLIDFEQANDPFEMATLKALNDRAELESIWTVPQPVSQTSSSHPTQTVSTVTSTQNLPFPRHNSTGSQLPPPSNTNITGSQTPPLSTPLLGNTTTPSVSSQTLTTPSVSSHTSTTPPVPKPRRFVPKPAVSDGGVSSNLGTQTTPAASHGPPPGSSQPQTPSPVTPAAVTTVHSRQPPNPMIPVVANPLVPNGGVPSQSPPITLPTSVQSPPHYSLGMPAPPKVPQSRPPPYSAGIGKDPLRPLPPIGGVGGVRVLPMPGGGMPNSSGPLSRPSPPVPPKPRLSAPPSQYKLEDPRPGLSTSERDQVRQISSMGFNETRTARAYKRLNKDEAKVLDFLVLVGNLEELGYNGNSAETALINCKDEIEEAVDYLKNVSTYKEMGYKEKDIHNAYNQGSKDWDKALDILLQS